MASRAPAGAGVQASGVVRSPDQNLPISGLLLEVALQAEIRVAFYQHLLVHRTMRRMARSAPFADRLMRENKGPFLHGVALKTGFLGCSRRSPPALDDVALVRVMAVAATHLTAQNWMGVRQIEFASLVEVALKARFRRLARIDDGSSFATGLDMQTPWTMARLATRVCGILPLRHEAGMRSCFEILRDLIMTRGAGFSTHEGCAGNLRRRHYRAVNRDARDGDDYDR